MTRLAICAAVAGLAAQGGGASAPSPRAMFEVLRSGSPVSLPADARATLQRLESKAPGSRIAQKATQTRRIGPRGAALYLVAASNGICVVHAGRGACSDDLAAISKHGVRFSVAHRQKPDGDTPLDIYGALPDGLGAVSAMVHGETTVRGAHAPDNGYRLRVPAKIDWMILTGPRGGTTVGPLGR